jgi:hypothetical protein
MQQSGLGTLKMSDEVKATWFIAFMAIAVFGLTSFFS